MKFSALVSALALTSAMTASGGAFAQTDEATIADYCSDLAVAEEQTDPGEIVSSEVGDEEDAEEPNAIEESTTETNLDTLTYEDCVEGGYID